jgi:hypothetical protein
MVRRGSTVRVRQRTFGVFLLRAVSVVVTGDDRQLRRPSDVQGLDVGGCDVRVAVEEPDCTLASVACEVAVMAVDHGQAGSMQRKRSNVEMPARSAKVANVWRRS